MENFPSPDLAYSQFDKCIDNSFPVLLTAILATWFFVIDRFEARLCEHESQYQLFPYSVDDMTWQET